MKSKIVCLVMASIMSVSLFAACGSGGEGSSSVGGNSRPKGKDIVIYAGGSSQYSWTEGSEEADVIEYIEQKYYEDTGISLNFKISFLSTDMTQKAETILSSGGQLDLLVSHTRGGQGVDDYITASGGKYYDISDILDEYGKNVLKYVSGEPIQSLTTRTGEVIGIPSAVNPYKSGILVRKDWMEACGYTDDTSKAEEVFSDGVKYKLVDNLETFTEMCLAMKAKYGLNHVITGAPWDIEKSLLVGAFGEAGYFQYVYDEEREQIVPGFATKTYQSVLNYEYNWVKQGLVSRSSNNILLEEGEANFIAASTGVFVLDPTVQHLIQVARKCKAQNPEAEFTVLTPLTETSETTKKGFISNGYAAFAACIPETSSRAVDIVKFMNWMYSDADNYNLCKYGVKGVHWVDNGDGTYSYPEGKDSYLIRPPYSGILAFVENQNISNLIYKEYTEEELKWLDNAKNKDYYIENDTVTYLWPTISGSVYNNFVSAKAVIYGDLALKSWVGDTEPTKSSFDTFIANYYSNGGNAYAEFLTTAYNQMKASRATGA